MSLMIGKNNKVSQDLRSENCYRPELIESKNTQLIAMSIITTSQILFHSCFLNC